MIYKLGQTRLSLKKADLTDENTEAIVNAANPFLRGGGGVDGAIHQKAGKSVLKECQDIIKEIGLLQTGKAVITGAGNLDAKYVIHTVGPVWQGGGKSEAELLQQCYINSLTLAREKDIKSISFPSISTGAYMYPIEEASLIALETIIDFLKNNDFLEELNIVLFSNKDLKIYEENILKLI